MRKPISLQLRLYWGLLTGMIVLVSLLPSPGMQKDLLSIHFDRYWFNFLTYVAVSNLPLLAWRRRTGLMLALGMAVLSVGLEALRGLVLDQSIDLNGMIVNLLGIAAGILLGLNILMIRSRMNRVDKSGIDAS